MIQKILKSLRPNSAVSAVAVAVTIFFLILTLLLFSSSPHQSLFLQNPKHPLNLPSIHILDSNAVLFPEWIVFNIVNAESSKLKHDGVVNYTCVFQNNATSPAFYAGTLASGKRTYKCKMPISVRGIRKLYTPALTNSELVNAGKFEISRTQLPRWNKVVYNSMSTAKDVVVFAKNVNRINHAHNASTIRCVFSNQHRLVRTPLVTSDQEVFRCSHPPPHLLLEGSRISVTLELKEEKGRQNVRIPSVANYVRTPETTAFRSGSAANSSICACTMVHNVGKFLKEWVMYHSAIGVEKFVLYDNDSDDPVFKSVVQELVDLGCKIETVFWPWPKAQEAGFSHSVALSKDCQWMMFLDVDEFVFSPKWTKSAKPTVDMLRTLLPSSRLKGQTASKQVGQLMIQCHDFGPSNQTSHPRNGVTQGYTCRRKSEERHKSIVLLDAVDESLQNSVHHFKVKSDVYKTQKVSGEKAVVNHYKFQAWPEFKTKFKRRVSTYVADWTEKINLESRDRTPGLGVEAVEPEGWAMKFCEVVDTKLQLLTRKWFGIKGKNQSSFKMVWES